jgi:TrmH family RNA methyltransferase
MENFGLEELVLVNPAPGILDDPQFEPMARGAVRIAEQAQVIETVEEAIADAELALAFTTRLGKRRRDGYDLRPAVEKIRTEAPEARVAAVFGREDTGLTTAELNRCHWLVRIPTEPGLRSLNLAQAVALFAYEVAAARKQGAPARSHSRKPATATEMEGLYTHLENVLVEIGFIEEASPDRMMSEMRRILSRRLPDPRDVRILRGALSKVELALHRARAGLDRGDPK